MELMKRTNYSFLIFGIFFVLIFVVSINQYIDIIKNGRRHRYIGFIIKRSSKKQYIKRSDLNSNIRKHCRNIFNTDCVDKDIHLIRFNGDKGILKCNHVEKEKAIKQKQIIHQILKIVLMRIHKNL